MKRITNAKYEKLMDNSFFNRMVNVWMICEALISPPSIYACLVM